MNRREILGVLGAGAASLTALSASTAFAQQEKGRHDHDQDHKAFEECLKACSDCADECNKMFHHCFELTRKGQSAHAHPAHVALDCAEFCTLSAKLIARHSPLMIHSCQACAQACDDCAAACETSDMEEMRRCAKVCRDCAKSCREMVDQMKEHHRHAGAPE